MTANHNGSGNQADLGNGHFNCDVIIWKRFPHYWPFMLGIHQSGGLPLQWVSNAGLWCSSWPRSGIGQHCMHNSSERAWMHTRFIELAVWFLSLLCERNPPVTGAFSSQRTSNMQNVSLPWHQLTGRCPTLGQHDGRLDWCQFYDMTETFESWLQLGKKKLIRLQWSTHKPFMKWAHGHLYGWCCPALLHILE